LNPESISTDSGKRYILRAHTRIIGLIAPLGRLPSQLMKAERIVHYDLAVGHEIEGKEWRKT